MDNLRQVTPFLHVRDLDAALAFFRDILGFNVDFRQNNYAYIHREGAGFRLLQSDNIEPGHGRYAYYIDMRDVDRLYAELAPKLAALPPGDIDAGADGPVNTDYGMRELAVRAPDGNWIVFGQDIGGVLKAVAPWTCPSCGRKGKTPFCPACGEKAPKSRTLGLNDVGRETFTAFTNVDGKLIRSLRRLIACPGELTAAFERGERARYLGPIHIFLLANGLFFALHPLSGVNVFSSTLDSNLHHQDWSGLAQTLVAERLTHLKVGEAAFAPLFDKAALFNAKALVILMAAALSLILPLVFWKARRPFAVHVVFSMHLYAFLLLLFCIPLLIVAANIRLGGTGLQTGWIDKGLALAMVAICAGYLWAAVARVYAVKGLGRVASVAALSVAAAALVLGYRFAIFLITLYTTKV